MAQTDLDLGRYQLGWSDEEDYVFKPKKGLNEEIVREMSAIKKEPDWMRDFRLKAFGRFNRKEMFPLFRGMGDRIAHDLKDLDFSNIYYYVKPTEGQVKDWNDLPDAIKNTYEKLGIPEAERKYLAGVTAQYESEVVFHRNRADLEAQGVLFCDMDTAVREHPDIVRKYFGTIIPPNDNKFAALNSAVWSGGSFIYVPPGVKVDMPLQAYFRINTENMGQFERTLIIADEGAQVHYIEGCSAPVYSTDSLHSAVVELVALPGSRITYTTIQNWSNNVYNLVTKRARAEAEARVEWIDGNIGSRLTMKYPSVYLMGPKASGEVLSVAYAGPGQHQDAGAKMIHAAPETTSTIVSKSISKDGGMTTYRGLVKVNEGAKGAKSFVRCDALLLDDDSVSETKPYMEVGERDASIGHEATVAKIGDDQLFYLMSRGLSESQAMGMIVNGFIEPITRTLPMEYAVEWSRLIELQMEGSVG
ncbi:MAG: Fe-S cluster assembly protein SufB [Acidimicrobiales bacterium]